MTEDLFAWIDRNLNQPMFPTTAVFHPEFSVLCVRMGPRWIPDAGPIHCLQFVRIAATQPNRGSFTDLVKAIQTLFPALGLYVELVYSERFAASLQRRGWIRIPIPGLPADGPVDFVLRGADW